MLGTLYVVISSSKEEDYQKVKEELLESILIFQYLLTKNHKWKKMLLNSLRLVK